MRQCLICGKPRTIFVRTDLCRCIACHLDVYEPRDQRLDVLERRRGNAPA